MDTQHGLYTMNPRQNTNQREREVKTNNLPKVSHRLGQTALFSCSVSSGTARIGGGGNKNINNKK